MCAAALVGCKSPFSDSEPALPSGTAVALTAHTADGTEPSQEALLTAQHVIRKRADKLGVSGMTVDILGTTLVVTVPGDDGSRARMLGQTGRLYIRPVLFGAAWTGSDRSADNAAANRQSTDPVVQQAALTALDCRAPDPIKGMDDPALPLVTCKTDGTEVFLLGPAAIDGAGVADAEAQFDAQNSRHLVVVTMTDRAKSAFAMFTSEYMHKRMAFTVDSAVLSAPTIMAPTMGGSTQISGNFTGVSAGELAAILGSGPLPLTFTAS